MGSASDSTKYKGSNTFEVILAIINYPEGRRPPEIEIFRCMRIFVEPTPSACRFDEAVCISARIMGIRSANPRAILMA